MNLDSSGKSYQQNNKLSQLSTFNLLTRQIHFSWNSLLGHLHSISYHRDRVSRLFSLFLSNFSYRIPSTINKHAHCEWQGENCGNSMKIFHFCAARLVKMWQLFSSIHPVKMWALRRQTLIVVILGLTVELTTASQLSGNFWNFIQLKEQTNKKKWESEFC